MQLWRFPEQVTYRFSFVLYYTRQQESSLSIPFGSSIFSPLYVYSSTLDFDCVTERKEKCCSVRCEQGASGERERFGIVSSSRQKIEYKIFQFFTMIDRLLIPSSCLFLIPRFNWIAIWLVIFFAYIFDLKVNLLSYTSIILAKSQLLNWKKA